MECGYFFTIFLTWPQLTDSSIRWGVTHHISNTSGSWNWRETNCGYPVRERLTSLEQQGLLTPHISCLLNYFQNSGISSRKGKRFPCVWPAAETLWQCDSYLGNFPLRSVDNNCVTVSCWAGVTQEGSDNFLINWVVKSSSKWPSVSGLLYCGLALIKSNHRDPNET